MVKRLDKTLADYVVGGVMPALLMGLLCSLCYFLLELAYSGAYMGQMKWILFFFIVGTVLIARISMRGDISERAGLYGIGLAIAAGLAMVRFVDIPKSALGGFGWLIPFSLMSIIWWSAHKLTQDSTWDDEEDDDGGGLLDASMAEPSAAATKRKSEHWFDTYQADRTEEQRKKKPGLMVVYFSLAALPLFGMGQAMIPATSIEARRYAFWMLTIYVGCGLGMLLTTSFLGLRRYLRGRRLQMPAAMTALWLGVGTAMILTLMVLSAVLLPRPEAEYKLSHMLGWATSKERDANDIHFFEGSGGKSDKQGNGPQQKQNQKGGQQQGKNGKSNQQNQKGNQAGQPDMQGRQVKQGASSKQGENGKSQGGQNGKQGETGKQGGNQQGKGDSGKTKGGQSEKNPQKGENQKQEDGDNSGNQKNPDRRNPNGKNQEQEKQQQNDQSREDQGQQDEERSSPPEPEEQQSNTSWDWLKWLVYALMAAGVLYALWKWGKQLLDGLKQIWNEILSWFRGLLMPQGKDENMTDIPDPESELPPKPFAWFSNPLNSPANFRSMEDMIRYSFAALHSWAYEQKMARHRDETPTEFAQRLGESVKHAHQDIRKLADLYSVVTYARTNAPQASETVLRNFWSRVT